MPDKDVFQNHYKKLNKAQKEAVDTVEGPVMVIAGPGTGKTQILTLRIANILRQTDTQPEQILALTFTKSGVYAMRRRLAEIIGSRAYKVPIHTFHSFCNEVIRNYPEEFPLIIGSNPATNVERIDILTAAILTTGRPALSPFGEPLFYLRSILTEIDGLKRENISPADLRQLVADQEKVWLTTPDLYHKKGAHAGKMKGKYQSDEKKIARNKNLADVYEAYEAGLRERKLYDFGDMVMEVIKRLAAADDFLLCLQEEYQYILADEHQDANGSQNQLLELLSNFHDNPNLFIVGDEKQAIFQFQGASLDNFNYFKKLYPTAKVIALEHNYRSRQGVLDSAQSLITQSQILNQARGLPLKATADKAPGIAIFRYRFSREEYEGRFLAEKAGELIASGTAPAEIAILYRDNHDAHKIAPYLAAAGLPYVIESNENILADTDICKLVSLLRAVADLRREEDLAKAIHFSWFGLSRLDIYRVLAAAARDRIGLGEVISKQADKLGADNETALRAWWEKMTGWNSQANNELLLPIIEQVINESGFLASLLQAPLALERIEVLRRFLDEARTLVGNRPEATLGDWLAYLDTLKEHNLALEAARLGESAGIRLLTAHRAKGLEFDHVFIIGARDGHWGNRHRPTYFSVPSRGEVIGDKLDDERRLFYVALTRAREAVYISYAEADESGNPALPAQFVEEIDKNLIETVDVSDLEEGWAVTPDFGFRPAVDSSLSATDREYLVQLFRRRGLSVTALNNYLDCPWKYFFKNLLRLPETRSRTLLYGTAVHETLEKLFKLYQKRGELPDQRLFLSLFTEALMRQPLTRTDFELSLAKGQVALLGYYEKYKKEWSSRVITEYSLTVPAWHEGVALTGKLDKLELSGDNLVNVVDYKTGGVKSRNEIEGQTKHSNGRLKRQLVFYKLLLDGDETKRYHFASAEIDFVEPAPSGAYKKEKFIITEAEAKTLAEQTKKVINGILNLDFWGQTCSDRDCEYCQLRKLLNY